MMIRKMHMRLWKIWKKIVIIDKKIGEVLY